MVIFIFFPIFTSSNEVMFSMVLVSLLCLFVSRITLKKTTQTTFAKFGGKVVVAKEEAIRFWLIWIHTRIFKRDFLPLLAQIRADSF